MFLVPAIHMAVLIIDLLAPPRELLFVPLLLLHVCACFTSEVICHYLAGTLAAPLRHTVRPNPFCDVPSRARSCTSILCSPLLPRI